MTTLVTGGDAAIGSEGEAGTAGEPNGGAPAAGNESQPGGESQSGGESGSGTDTTSGESQAGEAGADSVAGDNGNDSVAGAPDEYADFAAPDGVTLDTETTSNFKALAKELNLPQEAAQKLFDLGLGLTQKHAEANAQALDDMRNGWAQEIATDPELGGDNLKATTAAAQKAFKAFGSDAFRDLLEQSGLGNHPEIVRFAASVGRAISEDSIITGGAGPSPGKRTAQSFYATPMNP